MSPCRRARRDLTPFVLVLVAGAVVLFLLVGGLASVGRSSGAYHTVIDESFGAQARVLVAQSNSVGTELDRDFAEMSTFDRPELSQALDAVVFGAGLGGVGRDPTLRFGDRGAGGGELHRGDDEPRLGCRPVAFDDRRLARPDPERSRRIGHRTLAVPPAGDECRRGGHERHRGRTPPHRGRPVLRPGPPGVPGRPRWLDPAQVGVGQRPVAVGGRGGADHGQPAVVVARAFARRRRPTGGGRPDPARPSRRRRPWPANPRRRRWLPGSPRSRRPAACR